VVFLALGFSQWCVSMTRLLNLANLVTELLDGLILEKSVCLVVSKLMLMCLPAVTPLLL